MREGWATLRAQPTRTTAPAESRHIAMALSGRNAKPRHERKAQTGVARTQRFGGGIDAVVLVGRLADDHLRAAVANGLPHRALQYTTQKTVKQRGAGDTETERKPQQRNNGPQQFGRKARRAGD